MYHQAHDDREQSYRSIVGGVAANTANTANAATTTAAEGGGGHRDVAADLTTWPESA